MSTKVIVEAGIGRTTDLFKKYRLWLVFGLIFALGLAFKKPLSQLWQDKAPVLPPLALHQEYEALLKQFPVSKQPDADPVQVQKTGQEWDDAAKKFMSTYGEHVYAGWIGLMRVKYVLEFKQPQQWTEAKEQLTALINNPSYGVLHDLSRLRLAKVQWAMGEIDLALKTLQEKHGLTYDVFFNELKGDIYLSLDQCAAASKAYAETIQSARENNKEAWQELNNNPWFKVRHTKALQGE